MNKNPRYFFFEKLLGVDFLKVCIATTPSAGTQNTNLFLLLIFSFQSLFNFLAIPFQIN